MTEGMEAPATTQTQNLQTGAVKTDWAKQFYGQTVKSMSTPELWAGATAGFVAGTAVGFIAKSGWNMLKKRRK